MLAVIPYQVDVPMARWPIANFALIGFTIVFSVYAWANPATVLRPLILDGWSPAGLFGHMLLHAGPLHLLGNMVFLWAFGNAVCAKLGNLVYLLVYAALGLAAAATHNLTVGGPAIGASGAINGIVGMFLVFYPRNALSCLWIFFLRGGSFDCDSRVMILIWLAFDLWGALGGDGAVAYAAHLGGFAAGFGAASLMLALGLVRMTRAEQSIYAAIGHDIEGRLSPRRFAEAAPPPQVVARRTARPAATSPMNSPPTPPPSEPSKPYLRLSCACAKKIRVSARHAGRRARCPACAAALRIPTA